MGMVVAVGAVGIVDKRARIEIFESFGITPSLEKMSELCWRIPIKATLNIVEFEQMLGDIFFFINSLKHLDERGSDICSLICGHTLSIVFRIKNRRV